MKILGIGNGSREHAIAKKLSESKYRPKIYWVGEIRNPGIHRICKNTGGEYFLGKMTDPKSIVNLAKGLNVDFVFVGPEEPNFHGIPDALEEAGIKCIGAPKNLAIIEMSKAEMRRLQWKYDLPGKLLFKTFKNREDAYKFLEKYSDTLSWTQNVALKPARQAGGKGVKVIEDRQIYLHKEKERFKIGHVGWLEGYMNKYEDLEDRILIEENVWGPEYTLQCFVDGRNIVGMPMVQDNKNAHEFDIGNETGGMGSVAGPGMNLPFMTEDEFMDSIKVVKALVNAIQEETGMLYHGIVAGQMMLTEIEGPTIIEMYSRLGDPEALNVLTMMNSDLIDVCFGISDGKLSRMRIDWDYTATVVKAIAPKGYPEYRNLTKGHLVKVDENEIKRRGCELYWGSADLRDNTMITGGSRLLELVSKGRDHDEISNNLESCIEFVKLDDGWGMYHRSDIGSEELMKKREELAKRARMLYLYRKEKGIVGKRVDWIPGVGRVDPVKMLREEVRK